MWEPFGPRCKPWSNGHDPGIIELMTKIAIVEKSATIRADKEPVVIVPLRLWKQFEDFLEDQEALASKKFLRKIAKGRKDAARGKLLFPFR